MSLPVFNPPVPPIVGARIKREVRILEAQFSDGYTQAARDGVNHIRQVVDLEWQALTPAQSDEIIAFLEAQGGTDPFLYALPGKPQLRWTAREWEETYSSAGLMTITATFRQSFNLL